MTTKEESLVKSEMYKKLTSAVGSGNSLGIRVYRKARNFAELVDLVRAAEEKLKKEGVSDPEERIAMLRGIYYGTPWSRDYDIEKSDTRNIGFQTYTASGMPKDPRPALGEGLFKALYQSAEVKDKQRVFDFGHAIIGMHARVSVIARSVPLPSGGTGLESSTWLGDLGGGAGMLALRRVNNPNIRAKVIFENSHDYGAPANLEGDLGGFLIGCDDTADTSSLSLTVKNNDVAETLAEYLDGSAIPWKQRVRRFLLKYGAKFNGSTELANKEEIIAVFTGKIKIFSAVYITVRMKDKKLLSTDNLIGISRHLGGASQEVAEIFVESLIAAMHSGSDCLKGTTDPQPTTPESEFGGWKIFRDAFDIIDDILH